MYNLTKTLVIKAGGYDLCITETSTATLLVNINIIVTFVDIFLCHDMLYD